MKKLIAITLLLYASSFGLLSGCNNAKAPEKTTRTNALPDLPQPVVSPDSIFMYQLRSKTNLGYRKYYLAIKATMETHGNYSFALECFQNMEIPPELPELEKKRLAIVESIQRMKDSLTEFDREFDNL